MWESLADMATPTVTFDSNTWRPVVSPARFPNDPLKAANTRLRELLQNGSIVGYLADSMFTLEQIRRKDRRRFLGAYSPEIRVTEDMDTDGLSMSLSLGPDPDSVATNAPVVESHLQDALALGLRLLHAPRIGGVRNADLKEEYYVTQDPSAAMLRNELFGHCCQEIEKRGVGRARIVALGDKYAPDGAHWTIGIRNLPQDEDAELIRCVAEWADGEALAAHIAYGGTVFCTNENPGDHALSVFNPTNRAWLISQFGVRLVTPDTAAGELGLP